MSNKDRLLSQLEDIVGFSQKKVKKVVNAEIIEKENKGTILIIDDQPSMITYAETFLERDGYRVVAANSVKEARKILQADLSISLILTDLSMPEEDGFALLGFINSNIRFSHIPVIVTTSHSNPKVVMKAKEMGAKDYLVKPYTSETLIDRVRRIFLDSSTKILLVTDDELEILLLKRSLNRDNVSTIIKKSGTEACGELSLAKFDIIITDFILSDMTGIDLHSKVIDMDIDTPLLFIEDTSIKISNAKILAFGAHGIIRKPFNNNEIMKTIQTVISGD